MSWRTTGRAAAGRAPRRGRNYQAPRYSDQFRKPETEAQKLARWEREEREMFERLEKNKAALAKLEKARNEKG